MPDADQRALRHLPARRSLPAPTTVHHSESPRFKPFSLPFYSASRSDLKADFVLGTGSFDASRRQPESSIPVLSAPTLGHQRELNHTDPQNNAPNGAPTRPSERVQPLKSARFCLFFVRNSPAPTQVSVTQTTTTFSLKTSDFAPILRIRHQTHDIARKHSERVRPCTPTSADARNASRLVQHANPLPLLRLQTTEHDAFVSDRTRTTPPELAPPETGQSRSANSTHWPHPHDFQSADSQLTRLLRLQRLGIDGAVGNRPGTGASSPPTHFPSTPRYDYLRDDTQRSTTPRFTYGNGTMASSQPSLNGSRPSNPQTTPTRSSNPAGSSAESR
ncbi:hypothetical protein HMN09_00033100 [Mycena chlorophos]|uniref:Uncharacterized protein n=1 Tax=Mycena chlorophos TaxID=658473 RepID=A0A8H6WMF0_MYCCL|nr:hypothetical protein HMN09_00033100 [Mycena chlorophos]